ncbi:hypothetical protein B484DRAFT_405196 [Ochromonadaceae sp. CCMP2298]|nr:hypothetical protein B484DRAFT_405196 [Ochromonadaceae sp. CCMP2298]|mmetsp:Transcript_11155/g.24776  ORF Transcript_11155/g.24776 Transcript_11155/m.24776 type:complete len:153 (-) Transcript_11155:591-1049(-)
MVRLKHRYIIAQALAVVGGKLIAPGDKTYPVSSRDLQACLREKIRELYGDVGLGEFGQATYVKYLDARWSNIFIVKTTREAQVKVHFAMTCVTELPSSSVILRALGVSSCARTCLASLRAQVAVHFAQAVLPEGDRKTAVAAVEGTLLGLEL